MRARLHRFLLMLLMLVLPLQAVASAAMLDCMHSRPATAEPMAMAGEMAMADEAVCHEQSQSHGAPATQHDCKHCAACALASALPAPSSAAPAVLPHPTRYAPHPAESFSAFIPDGPERPPRTSLA